MKQEIPRILYGDLPTPNILAVQLLYTAVCAFGRWAKILSGRPHGEIPLSEPYGYYGLGWIPFQGMPVRFIEHE